MSIGDHGGEHSRVRAPLGALVAALLVLLAVVAPAGAVAGPTKLIDPAVAPRSGTPSTSVEFGVTYRNREGSPPDTVVVRIGATERPMAAPSGASSWKDGVRFTYRTTLPAGTHVVTFVAVDRDRFSAEVAAGTVTIVAPTPTPTPTAKPAPAPTPTPKPTPAPARSAAPPPAAAPTPSPTPDVPAPAPASPTPTLDPAASGPVDGAAPRSSPSASPPGTAAGNAGAPPPGDRGGAPSGGRDGRGSDPAADAGGWGQLARALSALGIDGGSGSRQIVSTLVTTTGAVTLAMAFLFFGKKRRDGEPPEPDEVLSAAAARGTPLPAGAALVPDALPAAGVGPAGPADMDALMPRWRRPSLLQARKADPLRDATAPAPSLSFAHGVVGPVEGRERRLIRYDVVRLMDAPDELRAAEIGFLAQGDEVQLLERSGAYWLVLCPDGRQGWVHKMTLGDVVAEAPAPGPRVAWSIGAGQDEAIDDDVLAAFMAARSRG